mgnify:FL=1
MPLIQRERSIIPSCDFTDINLFEKVVKETADIEGVGGYKIGFRLGYAHSVPVVVKVARRYTRKPIIFDHQKAATDIPDIGKDFVNDMKSYGVDAIILFPQAGPVTQRKWTEAALQAKLNVIIGGEMTHESYKRSENGYIADEALDEIYSLAAEQGVTDFVVPGNRVDRIRHYKNLIEKKGINPVFYSPGFFAQGGLISEATKVIGKKWHAIVGRAIYTASNIRKITEDLTNQL